MNQPDLHRSRGTDLASARNAYGVTAPTNGSQGGTMMQNIRRRVAARLAGEESGFTLIELLVVMLILGILAAIALPAFFNQKDKAGDAKAKENLHSMQVAMETCATDNGGLYGEGATGCTLSKLHDIEPTIPATSTEFSATPEEEGYTLEADGSAGNEFEIVNEAGELSFPCTTGGTGGCTDDSTPGGAGTWGS